MLRRKIEQLLMDWKNICAPRELAVKKASVPTAFQML